EGGWGGGGKTASACVPPGSGCPSEARRGCEARAGSPLVVGLMVGLLPRLRMLSTRHKLPSRSPAYAMVMNRELAGPVDTGSACRAFLMFTQPLAAARQLLAEFPVSFRPSLPTSLLEYTVPVLASRM